NMTHQLIANMLGVRREGVAEAACKLKRLGVIDYSRGHITVLDRPALEELSCECYGAAKREEDRLMSLCLRSRTGPARTPVMNSRSSALWNTRTPLRKIG